MRNFIARAGKKEQLYVDVYAPHASSAILSAPGRHSTQCRHAQKATALRRYSRSVSTISANNSQSCPRKRACRPFCSHAGLDGLEKSASVYSDGRPQNTFWRRLAGGSSRNGERPPCGPSSRPTTGQGTPTLSSSTTPNFPSPVTTATGKRTTVPWDGCRQIFCHG